MSTKKEGELVSNRKARYQYEILEVYEAGVVLLGTEVKSLRESQASLDEAYVRIIDNELWLVGASIAPYKFGSGFNHEERRDRKLLMKRNDIERLKGYIQEKGLTLIPLALYLKNGRVKLRLARARGKKLFDKRAAIKERSEERRLRGVLKREH